MINPMSPIQWTSTYYSKLAPLLLLLNMEAWSFLNPFSPIINSMAYQLAWLLTRLEESTLYILKCPFLKGRVSTLKMCGSWKCYSKCLSICGGSIRIFVLILNAFFTNKSFSNSYYSFLILYTQFHFIWYVSWFRLKWIWIEI